MKKVLSHFDSDGNAKMVNISSKRESSRMAQACGYVHVSHEVMKAIKENKIIKGDVLTTAKISGIMAAKQTSNLIPMCHPIAVDEVNVSFKFLDQNTIYIESLVECFQKTGPEMEAVMAVSVAAMTIYDMCKAMDKKIVISKIHLKKKSGGKSGEFKFE